MISCICKTAAVVSASSAFVGVLITAVFTSIASVICDVEDEENHKSEI